MDFDYQLGRLHTGCVTNTHFVKITNCGTNGEVFVAIVFSLLYLTIIFNFIFL